MCRIVMRRLAPSPLTSLKTSGGTAMKLGNPEALIKTMVARSVSASRSWIAGGRCKCAARNARLRIQANCKADPIVGKGQIKSADFYIIPDIVGPIAIPAAQVGPLAACSVVRPAACWAGSRPRN